MEEYLRRVQSRLGEDEGPIHAVLGGPEPDVDTVAATLCLALHLSQKELPGRLCVPVLRCRRSDVVLPGETVRYLQRLKICDSLLLWREDVDLVKLHHTRGLSLTMLRDGLLDSTEYHTLESSILRVVHHVGQQDAGDDGASSAVTTVTRELLQEAAEHIGVVLGETLGEALRLQSEALWSKHGCRSPQLEELMRSLVQWSGVTAGQDLEQLLTMELKEYSDGEMTIALTSVTTDKEDWQDCVEGLKSLSEHHGYDGIVVLLSIMDKRHHPCQQVAVYSNDTHILNQICCELEESSSWSLSGELEARKNLQVYHIPINTSLTFGTPPLLIEEMQDLLKDFVDRRGSVLACHPSSRTSSTEGVAGSVDFSQGSSGINDMDGSDIERAEGGGDVAALASRVTADGEDDTGSAGVCAVGDLMSPDSGMTTIRSSRSSKESSVFLSDDSPVGEVIAVAGPATGPGGLFLRNPSPLGLLSLSPPVPPERRKHHSNRNKNDNSDLFSFDPLHSNDPSMSSGGKLANSKVREEKGEKRQDNSSFSELEELTLLDFSAVSSSLGRLESRDYSVAHHSQTHRNDLFDTMIPPTPVNSVVDSHPSGSCGVRSFPEDAAERITGLRHKDSVSSSLSETWDELGFDTQEALPSSNRNSWNRTTEPGSPQHITEENREKESVDMTEQGNKKEILQSDNSYQRPKTLEPQLSLITEQTESYDNWNPDSILKDQWNSVTLAYLQLTPPDEEVTGRCRVGIIGMKEKPGSLSTKKAILNTLTPDTSKEEDEGVQGKKGDRQMELLDFWTYSAQKGFQKSDSGTTTSYPESLDMWNMTIHNDSLSPLTTPENLSETSGSFCKVNPNAGANASVEGLQEFSDSGMMMWNTTIQEDSSSTITSPEGTENGKDLSHMGSLDTSDSPEIDARNLVEEEKTIKEQGVIHNVLSEPPDEVGWKGSEHNVKIVIEVDEGRTQGDETGYDDIQSIHSKQSDWTSPSRGTDTWDVPVSGMVNSSSEYDNVGAATWSLTSSTETYVSPVTDIIQLEGQSSPFVAVTNPSWIDKKQELYQRDASLGKGEYRAKEPSASQVFLFEGNSELGHTIRIGGSSTETKYEHKSGNRTEEADCTEHPSDHSPFVLVNFSTVTQDTSANHYLSPEEDAMTENHTGQSLWSSLGDWDSFVSEKHDRPGINSLSNIPQNTMAQNEDGSAPEIQGDPTNDSTGNVKGKTTETMSLRSSSWAEQDTLKYSPDSLHPDSRDDLRSNSDGDSSSVLEMEYIILSGTVKEATREPRPKQGDRPSKWTGKYMETFSMLSYAATVLQSQAQEHQENTEQSRQNQTIDHMTYMTIGSTAHAPNADTEQNEVVLSTHYQASLTEATEHHIVPEMMTLTQSKNNCSQTQVEQGNYDDNSSIVASSMSPSLRYPSDHFLKTREEVYVHSQISMEDSDEGGQSPSATPLCTTSLGDLQVWRGQLAGKDTPQTTSEPQSPVLTNSSVSYSSSLIGTPLSESGISTDRGLGLPFSGDLMEEENDEQELEEDINIEHAILPKLTLEAQSARTEGQQLGSPQLLNLTEEINGGCPFQHTDLQRDRLLQNTVDYYDEQPTRNVYDHNKWSSEQQTRDHEASQDSYSPISRHQNVTSQFPSRPTSENAAYQWTGSHNVTQGQIQYGYNYHHIDQRTENQEPRAQAASQDAKADSQPNTRDVYVEITTEATAMQFGSEFSLDDPSSKFKYMAESQYGEDSMLTSELECSQDQADESHHVPYQLEGYQCQSDVHLEREDHAQYVPKECVHFLLERHSQQEKGASGMMMKMASSEEAVPEMDNREDQPSSADLSGGSNQRRKLVAPAVDVSLEHSDGSHLSEDALDTEDDALDTGDDADVSIDELDTPDEADLPGRPEESNLGAGGASSCAIGHITAVESRDSRLWRSVVIGEQEHRIDMKCIEPYRRVISHGGYYAEQNAIIVFAACFLPDSNCDNYNYVMENLFLYVISTLELMVAEDYMIVYLNGATPRRRMPGFTWMKKCYQMIDRRLRKNLKMFIIVHPSWFIRTLLGITRPFISSKFSSKIKYVTSLQELGEIIPIEYVHIPPSIVKLDTELQETAVKANKKRNSVV